MKRILIAIAVLILLYPAVAWLMGLAIEQRIDRLAYQGQSPAPQLRLLQKTRHGIVVSDEDSSYEIGSTLKVTRHYHRGWYSSVDEATVEASIAALSALPALTPAVAAIASGGSDRTPLRVSLRTVIHHGPFCGWTCFGLAGADSHVSFTGPLQTSLARLFGSREPIAIRSRFAFFGGGSVTVSVPAFDRVQLGQDVRLGWGGLQSTMHYGAQQDWYDLTATAPSLRLEGVKGTVAADGMSIDLHRRRALRSLYQGDSRMELKRLSVTGEDAARQFTVDELLVAGRQSVQDRFMSASYQLGTGAVHAQSLTLSGAHFDFTWKHLGLEPLESLTTAMNSVRQQQGASDAPAMRARNTMAALKQPIEALLLNQPEMDVDRVSIATAHGQGLVTGVVRLVGAGASDFDAPALLLRKLDLRLDFVIDEAFLQDLPGAGANVLAQLQPMIDKGYITRANGALRTQLIFREGQATLNGRPFNPAAAQAAVPTTAITAPVLAGGTAGERTATAQAGCSGASTPAGHSSQPREWQPGADGCAPAY